MAICAVGQEEHAFPDSHVDSGEGITSDHLRDMHQELDNNKDSAISKEELLKFVEKQQQQLALQQDDPASIVHSLDTSKDGKISLEEHLQERAGSSPQDFVCDDSFCEEKVKELRATKEKKMRDETELFHAADKNKDGVLDLNEVSDLSAPQESGNVYDVLVSQSMKEGDQNGDNKMNEQEFNEAYFGQLDKLGGAPMSFSEVDENSDGFVDHEELRSLGAGKRERIVDNVVQSLDKNGDARIDAAELIRGKDQILDSELQQYLIQWANKAKKQIPVVV